MKDNKLNYTDDKNNKLYGFSVADMQEYNKRLKDNTKAIYVIGLLFILVVLGVFVFLFWYVHAFNILGNTLRILSRC